jgi:hypothetical protein
MVKVNCVNIKGVWTENSLFWMMFGGKVLLLMV